MPKDFFKTIVTSKVVLWQKGVDKNLYTISLTFPYHDMEGDLALIFDVNGAHISIASFSIIDGNMVGINNEHMVFIARVQGTSGQFELIRQATKALNEVSPNIILVLATQAIASALGIESIAGITTKEHIIYDEFNFDYDELWVSMGGEKVNEQVFHLPSKPHNKPMAMVKMNHRCRTKRKRQFKLDIYNHIILEFQQKCLDGVCHSETDLLFKKMSRTV